MQKVLAILPLVAALFLLHAAPAHAQQQTIYCDAVTNTPCNTSVNAGNGAQGDPAWQALGKVNANFAQLYGMFGPSSNLKATGIVSVTDLIGLFSGVPSASSCLGSNGTLTACIGLAASGDATGATDATAINALLAAGKAVQLQCNTTYYVNATIAVSANYTTFEGCGYSTIIQGVGTISGPLIYVTGAAVKVGGFLAGGSATNILKVYGSYSGTHIHDIKIPGCGTCVDVVWFGTFFGSLVDNISMAARGSASDFHFDGGVNADTFNNLYTESSYTSGYNFYFQNDTIVGGSSGNTFNALTAQGGTTGFYFGAGYVDSTWNSPYCEAVVHCMVFGDATHSANALTLNSPYLGGPDPIGNASNGYASRQALVDFYNASGITLNSPDFVGSYLINTFAQPMFSGGGCSTEPLANARVSPSGVVTSIILEYPGAGCTSPPTVNIVAGSSGSGATATATCCTSGQVTALTLTAGGNNYGPNVPPVPITFNSCSSITINTPNFNAGTETGLTPWIVHHSGAQAPSGITVLNDNVSVFLQPLSGFAPTGNLYMAPNYTNTEYLTYLNISGVQTAIPINVPAYP
jgi:hypothetical protein